MIQKNKQLAKSIARSLGKERKRILLDIKKWKYNSMLARAVNLEMTLPKLAYHITGNNRGKGMIEQGLIKDKIVDRKRLLKLTELGELVCEELENDKTN